MAPAHGGEGDYSNVDFYELLSVPFAATESQIRSAYRKTSRLYHPDKVTPTPETLEKFQLLQAALSVLTDVAERAKYDQGREAKERRKAENEALEGRRRKMKEDLERREAEGGTGQDGSGGSMGINGTKRSWSERELEIKRIAEQNRRRREDTIAKRRKEFRDAEEQAAAAKVQTQTSQSSGNDRPNGTKAEPLASNAESLVDRSVKIRWIKEGDGLDVDESTLMEMFPAGHVENVVLLKDKKRKLDGREKKAVMGTAVLVFSTLGVAKKAVANGAVDEMYSIEWAKGAKEAE